VLAVQKIANDGCGVCLRRVSFDVGQTGAAESAKDEVDIRIKGWDDWP
jgi:hypothetical protein